MYNYLSTSVESELNFMLYLYGIRVVQWSGLKSLPGQQYVEISAPPSAHGQLCYEGQNCIVLYLCIYIALLAVHTNQKRFQKFQCERPREKRAVLREQKEAVGSPVNNVIRMTVQFDGKMRPRVRRLANHPHIPSLIPETNEVASTSYPWRCSKDCSEDCFCPNFFFYCNRLGCAQLVQYGIFCLTVYAMNQYYLGGQGCALQTRLGRVGVVCLRHRILSTLQNSGTRRQLNSASWRPTNTRNNKSASLTPGPLAPLPFPLLAFIDLSAPSLSITSVLPCKALLLSSSVRKQYCKADSVSDGNTYESGFFSGQRQQ